MLLLVFFNRNQIWMSDLKTNKHIFFKQTKIIESLSQYHIWLSAYPIWCLYHCCERRNQNLEMELLNQLIHNSSTQEGADVVVEIVEVKAASSLLQAINIIKTHPRAWYCY